MMYRFLFLILTFSFTSCMAQHRQPFADYRWSHRLLLVFSPDLQNETLRKQQAEWSQVSEGMEERNLKIWVVTPEDIQGEPIQHTAASLYERYQVASTDFEVILIGKDGGIKQRQNHLLTSQNLFAIIDAMPMRRNEMRQKNE